MNRTQVTATTIGGLVAVVYVASLLYAPGPLSVATVSVRFSGPCLALARDAGYDVHQYERLMVPVESIQDGGALALTFPQAARTLGSDCAVVMDWNTVTLDTCANHPGVCEAWDAGFPFQRAQRRCLRAHFDAGLPCPLVGGASYGDWNVSPRAARANPAQCEEVECVVNAGENPEESL